VNHRALTIWESSESWVKSNTNVIANRAAAMLDFAQVESRDTTRQRALTEPLGRDDPRRVSDRLVQRIAELQRHCSRGADRQPGAGPRNHDIRAVERRIVDGLACGVRQRRVPAQTVQFTGPAIGALVAF
jgi:hypothetical protein